MPYAPIPLMTSHKMMSSTNNTLRHIAILSLLAWIQHVSCHLTYPSLQLNLHCVYVATCTAYCVGPSHAWHSNNDVFMPAACVVAVWLEANVLPHAVNGSSLKTTSQGTPLENKGHFTPHWCSLDPSEQIHEAAYRSEAGKIDSIADTLLSFSFVI